MFLDEISQMTVNKKCFRLDIRGLFPLLTHRCFLCILLTKEKTFKRHIFILLFENPLCHNYHNELFLARLGRGANN